MRTLVAIAAAAALASCGQEREASPDPESLDQERPLSPLISQYDDLAAVVSANGVAPFQGEALNFGTSKDAVDAALTESFGVSPDPLGLAECGDFQMEYSKFGPLHIGYLDGRFAGWFLSESPIGGEGGADGVATTDGIRPGVSQYSALKDARRVRELETTLDGEFQYETADYGQITGFAERDRIVALQAGIGCKFGL